MLFVTLGSGGRGYRVLVSRIVFADDAAEPVVVEANGADGLASPTSALENRDVMTRPSERNRC